MDINGVKEAGFADETIKNLITYLRQNKSKLENALSAGGAPKLQQELAKTPAGGSSKGSLVTGQVEQWLKGMLNDNALTQGIEKIFKQSSLGLDSQDDPSSAFDQGEEDLQKYGSDDMSLLSDDELFECYAAAEEAIEKGDNSAYEEIKACELEMSNRGLGKKTADLDTEEFNVGDPLIELTPDLINDGELVEKVFTDPGSGTVVLKSDAGAYYGMEPAEGYFIAYLPNMQPDWVKEQEKVVFNDSDKEMLRGMGIQGKKKAKRKSMRVAAPQVVAFSKEIEDVISSLILGRVRDVMKKLGTQQEMQGIKDLYFQMDEVLHKALKLAQTGTKQISENVSKIRESSVKEVEVVATKEAAMDDLNDYAHDIVHFIFIDHKLSEVRNWNPRLLKAIVDKYIDELFPESNFEEGSDERTHVRDMAVRGVQNYFSAGGYDENGVSEPAVQDNLQFDQADKDVLKSMGIKGSFSRFNAAMEDGGFEHVVEVMAPEEIDGLATALPEDYTNYPELSSVKDLLVDALIKINEFESSKFGSKHACSGDCEDCDGTHDHADVADSNTAANVDTTGQGTESFYAEHDAVYASLDSTKLMLEASKYASTVEIKAVTDAPTAESHGDTVENAEEFILSAVDKMEEGTVGDLQAALLAANYSPQVAQLAISNCLGVEALLVLSSPITQLLK